MIFMRIETVTFPRHTEILTRETSCNHVYFFRENQFPCLVPFHEIHDTFLPVNIRRVTVLGEIMGPSRPGLFQNIIGENKLETSRM